MHLLYKSRNLFKCLKAFRKHFLLIPAILIILLFLLPFLNLVSTSFHGYYNSMLEDSHISIENYTEIINQPAYLSALKRSTIFSVECTVACLLVGYPLAFLLSRARKALRSVAIIVIATPLFMNLLITSSAWTVILQRKGVLNWILMSTNMTEEPKGLLYTAGAVLIGMIYVLLPLMILPILAGLLRIDNTYIEAARSLGASPYKAFLKITLPLSLPSIIAGVLLVFISSFGLYLIPEMLGGPTHTLLPFFIQQQTLDSLNWPMAASLSVFLIMLVLPPLIIIEHVFWKYQQENSV